MTRFPLLTGARFTPLALALAFSTAGFVASGCTSGGDKKPSDGPPPVAADDGTEDVQIDLFTDEDRYTGIPEEKLQFRDIGESSHSKDSDVNFDSSDKTNFDAYEVAQWVHSRKLAMDWCLTQKKSGQDYVPNAHGGQETTPYKKVFVEDPKRDANRLDQALSIAMRIVDKVPDTPEARMRLAQMCFIKGSYHFWAMDAASWEILDAQEKEKAIGSVAEDKREATLRDLREKVKKIEPVIDRHRRRMIAYHTLSLKQFQAYEAALPLPGNHPIDYYFKINFQLGNIPEALKFLTEILDNPELKPETRVKYEALEKEIKEFLADRRINESAPLPGSPEFIRQKGKKRTEPRPEDEGAPALQDGDRPR